MRINQCRGRSCINNWTIGPLDVEGKPFSVKGNPFLFFRSNGPWRLPKKGHGLSDMYVYNVYIYTIYTCVTINIHTYTYMIYKLYRYISIYTSNQIASSSTQSFLDYLKGYSIDLWCLKNQGWTSQVAWLRPSNSCISPFTPKNCTLSVHS